MRYDVTVIGNDEAAFVVSCTAAMSGLRTLAVLPEQRHSSWLMSQALLRLNGELLCDRSPSRRGLLKQYGSPRLLYRLVRTALTQETVDLWRALDRCGVDVLGGECQLLSGQAVRIVSSAAGRRTIVETRATVIATGVRRSALIRSLGLMPVLTPESALFGLHLPTELTVLEGGDFGAGLAALFQMFGVRVSLLSSDDADAQAVQLALEAGVTLAKHPAERGLVSPGNALVFSPRIMDCRRISGFTSHLGLPQLGVEPDEHGQLWCGSSLETWCEDLFGAGEVVGFACGVDPHPKHQAARIVNRLQHRIRAPHFLTHPRWHHAPQATLSSQQSGT